MATNKNLIRKIKILYRGWDIEKHIKMLFGDQGLWKGFESNFWLSLLVPLFFAR